MLNEKELPFLAEKGHIVSLVGELCDEYDIEIGADEIVPENFNSVEAIWALVQRLQED